MGSMRYLGVHRQGSNSGAMGFENWRLGTAADCSIVGLKLAKMTLRRLIVGGMQVRDAQGLMSQKCQEHRGKNKLADTYSHAAKIKWLYIFSVQPIISGC